MTMYAASNRMAVTVSPEGHGGCGVTHRRPVHEGKPADQWVLDCPPCEDYLRSDTGWSATIVEVPETYDETKKREQSEKSGKLDRENQLAAAIIELSKLGQLPQSLGNVLASVMGTPAAALVGTVVCPEGHDNPAGKKFCADCGAPMSTPVMAAALPGPERPDEPPAAPSFPSPGDRQVRLQDLRLDELQAACRARGIEDYGVRKELMKRLRTAGVTNADLQHLLAAA
jgi:hypothetical protein